MRHMATKCMLLAAKVSVTVLVLVLPFFIVLPANAATLSPAVMMRDAQNGCAATAYRGSLITGSTFINAGGPNFVSGVCRDINIRLTGAVYRTYAKACLETSRGLDCGRWVRLYPNEWQVLRPDVLGVSRWQLHMKSDGLQTARFYLTN